MSARDIVNRVVAGTMPAPTWVIFYDINFTEHNLMEALEAAVLSFVGSTDGLTVDISAEAHCILPKWSIFAQFHLSKLVEKEKVTLCILLEACFKDVENLQGEVRRLRMQQERLARASRRTLAFRPRGAVINPNPINATGQRALAIRTRPPAVGGGTGADSGHLPARAEPDMNNAMDDSESDLEIVNPARKSGG